MLMSIYSANIEKVVNSTGQMSEAEIKLLNLIRSKGRLEWLLEILPEGWEKTFEINYYEDPNEVSKEFREEKISKDARVVYDRKVNAVIFNRQTVESNGQKVFKFNAVPAKYDEHKRRDYDYPIEDDMWKPDDFLSKYTPGFFHVDHKLIWIVQERKVENGSDLDINDIPYKYSINIYVPTEETMIEVEKIKKLGSL